ncbi:MAG: hypothetical protein FJ100_09820 [Deltaproteobacteria bacterium]|nr:hypothetical protein [Deltaproteobacteria bacterium]
MDLCQSGACANEPQAGACDDGDACTQGDYCALGLCLSGSAKDCDDGLDCTVDSCGDGQCLHAGDTQPEQKTCQGQGFVEVFDACGAGPTLQECPADKPCGSGVCGGPPDPQPAADAGGAGAAVPSQADGDAGVGPAKDSISGVVADLAGGSGAGAAIGAGDASRTAVAGGGATGGTASGCHTQSRPASHGAAFLALLLAAAGLVRLHGRRRSAG